MPRRDTGVEFRTEVRASLGEIRSDLKEHMRRTDALERFQARWSGAFIALTTLGTVGGIVIAVLKIAEFFR